MRKKRYIVIYCCFIYACIINYAVAGVNISPYFAVYDISLESVTNPSAVIDMRGRIVEKMFLDADKNYKTYSRFLLKSQIGGERGIIDQRSQTLEAKDGSSLNFFSEIYNDNYLWKTIEGSAKKRKGEIFVSLMKPSAESAKISSAHFPMEEVTSLLRAAQSGKKFYTIKYYDGMDGDTKVKDIAVFLGEKAVFELPKSGVSLEAERLLKGHYYWPVSLSFYDNNSQQDGLPYYRSSFFLFDNGLMDNILMEYKEYALKAKLHKLEYLYEQPSLKRDKSSEEILKVD